ncbi:MAG: hypothetical protein LBJ67_01125 [Planctomycetaceae bacterium]|jgi:uncharacterized protein (TIGR03545 family)|nr:hypothetical protein [Planctomycetaceae bacterium]
MAFLKFFIPRILILAVILIVSWFSLNMVIRRTLVSYWQNKTATNMEIGKSQISLDPTQALLENVQITTAPGGNQSAAKIAVIEKVQVQFDRNELLRRRFIANDTRLHNVRLEALKLGENGLDLTQYWQSAQSQFSQLADQFQNLPLDDFMLNNLDDAAKKLARDFETYNFGDKLVGRWNKEIADFREKANSVKQRIETMKTQVGENRNQPDKIALAIAVLQQIEQLDQEIAGLRDAVPRIEQMIRSDKQSLKEAVQRDQKRLDSLSRPKTLPINFSEYILGKEMREKLTGLIAWTDWGRMQIPPEDTAWFEQMRLFSPKRAAGKTITLPDMESQAEVHFRGIGIDGQALVWEQPVYFAGGIRDFTNQPHKLAKPLVFRFCVSKEPLAETLPEDYLKSLANLEPANIFKFDQIQFGRQPPFLQSPLDPQTNWALNGGRQNVTNIDFFRLPEAMKPESGNQNFVLDIPTLYVTAALDRTGKTPHDRFLISCPDYALPQRILGNPHQLAFQISPGISQFRAELEIHGDVVSGKLALLQSPVTIKALLPKTMQGTPIERSVMAAADALTVIQAEISISGSRTNPQYSFYSNVGDQLAMRVEPFLQQEWTQVNQKLVSLLDNLIKASEGNLNAVVTNGFQPMFDEINGDRQTLATTFQQSGLDVNQLIQSHLPQMSEKDQKQWTQILNSPIAQSLLRHSVPQQPLKSSDTLGQMILRQLDGEPNNAAANSPLVGQLTNELDTKARELINKHATPEVQNALRNVLGNAISNGQSSNLSPPNSPANPPNAPANPAGESPLYQSSTSGGKTLYP